MGVEPQTGGKQEMDISYARAPVPHSVEKFFEEDFQDHDGLTSAQFLLYQQTLYESLQRNTQIDTSRSSNTTPRGGPDARQQIHENSSQIENAESQLAMDEAYAKELQELEIHSSHTSINRNYGTGTGVTSPESSTANGRGNSAHNTSSQENSSQIENAESQLAMDEAYARGLQELEIHFSHTSINGNYGTGTGVTRAESSTTNSRGNSAHNTSSQITIEDDVDPDNMTYEQLQSLGEAIGTNSRGLSDELISFLPVSTYNIGLFKRREDHEKCPICYMAYKKRDKLITLPCQHQYHKGCITKWLNIKKICPLCKDEVFGS